jgi:hypothetical protein
MIRSAPEQVQPLHWLFERAGWFAASCSGTLSCGVTETGAKATDRIEAETREAG